MNMQEVFNYVLEKIVAQGTKSVRYGQCRYRGTNGAKCAIGWLIPDEEYDPDMEGVPVGRLLQERLFAERMQRSLPPALQKRTRKEWIEFLRHLQQAHDNSGVIHDQFVENFIAAMKWVAALHELEFPDLEYGEERGEK